jgi:hypothetical protein
MMLRARHERALTRATGGARIHRRPFDDGRAPAGDWRESRRASLRRAEKKKEQDR